MKLIEISKSVAGVSAGHDRWSGYLLPGLLLLHGGHLLPSQQDQETRSAGQLHVYWSSEWSAARNLAEEAVRIRNSVYNWSCYNDPVTITSRILRQGKQKGSG